MFTFRDAIIKLGYAGVSTNQQDLALQLTTLKDVGVSTLFALSDHLGVPASKLLAKVEKSLT